VAGACHLAGKSRNKLAHLGRTWARVISMLPYLEVGTGGPENGFLVFLKASLGYGDKQSEYFHIVRMFCGKLGNLFPPLFFKEKKLINFTT